MLSVVGMNVMHGFGSRPPGASSRIPGLENKSSRVNQSIPPTSDLLPDPSRSALQSTFSSVAQEPDTIRFRMPPQRGRALPLPQLKAAGRFLDLCRLRPWKVGTRWVLQLGVGSAIPSRIALFGHPFGTMPHSCPATSCRRDERQKCS